MIPFGNGTGFDAVCGVAMGVLYGIPAFAGAVAVRALLRPLWRST